MTALSKGRKTAQRSGDTRSFGMAAAVVAWAGGIAAVDANGNATPMAVSTTLKGVGRFEETVDNSAGAADALTVSVRRGIFNFVNSAAADELTKADIGATCYGVDDQTVAKTDGTGTRSPVGTVYDVDDLGVWVEFT